MTVVHAASLLGTSTIPLPMVLATVVPNIKKATKLKNAAQTTACLGDKTLVETTVEMEFGGIVHAVSEVKMRAKAMTKMANTLRPIMASVSALKRRFGRDGQRAVLGLCFDRRGGLARDQHCRLLSNICEQLEPCFQSW